MQMNAVSAMSTFQHVTNSPQIVATASRMVPDQHRMETPYVIWLAQETPQKLVVDLSDWTCITMAVLLQRAQQLQVRLPQLQQWLRVGPFSDVILIMSLGGHCHMARLFQEALTI
jgi:hypothetical protein